MERIFLSSRKIRGKDALPESLSSLKKYSELLGNGEPLILLDFPDIYKIYRQNPL